MMCDASIHRAAMLLLFTAVSTAGLLGQYTNVRVNNAASTDPEEVTISIDPTNPLHLAAGANITYYYYSTNGGMSWSQGNLTSSLGVWGDPSVIFDGSGNLYFGHLSNPSFPGYWIDRIVVQKSTDGGQSWDDGEGIGFNPPRRQQDKEWLAADMTASPYEGNLYVAWTQFDSYGSASTSDSSRILFSRSTDAGAKWSTPVRVSDRAGNCLDSDSTVEGAVPAVGPDGEVYLTWSGPLGIMFDKSTDGGDSFGSDIFVTSQPGGWDFNISGIYRCNGMPVTACDVSRSPYRGTIYVQWSDQRNGPGNTDIFLIKSTDAGQTWGGVKRVNDDTTSREQFFSWMTVDQVTGYVYVVFYDRRNTSGDATDVYVARSTDGGETFTNFKVSKSSFTPSSGIFFGDYTNVAARNGRIYPIWMRLDEDTLSVWTALIDESVSLTMPLAAGWNMVSVPLRVDDERKTTLFPSAISSAFNYRAGYAIADTLHFGEGYWVKLAAPDSGRFSGTPLATDSIAVAAGWNLIGSISAPVPVSTISSSPPGIATSQFYAYRNASYQTDDTIRPGAAYWVKTSQAGNLILSSQPQAASGARISIAGIAETPPPPPEEIYERTLPLQFALEQNFPNPFNPLTVIRYSSSVPGHVILAVFDVLGREVARLVDEIEAAGPHQASFDAGRLSSGIYFYRLVSGSQIATRKMVVMR